MELKPLTLEQAAEIADDFEDLIGSCIHGFDSPEITHVVVGPFNREHFTDFVKNNPVTNDFLPCKKDGMPGVIYMRWLAACAI